ncbi:MAG: hypothetical protein AAF702_43985 [Chloroflexota bacterium]
MTVMTNIELKQQKRQQVERLEILRDGVIDWLSVWGPLCSPLVPAGLTGVAIITHFPTLLEIPLWSATLIALITAVVIEILGIVAIETFLDMRRFNQTVREGEEPAPERYAGGVVLFYLVIVVGLVFLLKIWHELALYSLVPLTLLGFVTSWTIVLRKQHSARVYKREMLEIEDNETDRLRRQLDVMTVELGNVTAERDKLRAELAVVHGQIEAVSRQNGMTNGFDIDNGRENHKGEKRLSKAKRQELLMAELSGDVDLADIDYDKLADKFGTSARTIRRDVEERCGEVS